MVSLIWILTVFSLGGVFFPFYEWKVMLVVIPALIVLRILKDHFHESVWVPASSLLGRLPRFINRTAYVFLSLIIFVGLLEWTTEALAWTGAVKIHVPMVTQFLRRGTEDWRMVHIIADDEARLSDPVLFWRPAPRYPYNAQGFKGPLAQVPKPEDVFRIMTYGDSHTDGPREGSWSQRLHESLTEHSLQDGMRFEVLNAGVAGYSSYQGLKRFQEDVKIYEPDLIFVSFGWNDLPTALHYSDKEFRVPPLVPVMRMMVNYKFYRALLHYASQFKKETQASQGMGMAAKPRVSLDDYVENMEGFLETASRYGANVVFLTRPHEKPASELKSAKGWRKNVPLYNQRLLEFARSKNAASIDIQNIFEEQYPQLFNDECHLTDKGNLQMAQILRKHLKKTLSL